MEHTHFFTISPISGAKIKEYSYDSAESIQSILEENLRSFKQWRRSPKQERTQKLEKLKKLFIRDSQLLANTITLEMGKLPLEAKAEIEKCVSCIDYYIQQVEFIFQKQQNIGSSYVCYEPLGPILAIMPWNFPFWQVVRAAIPNILIGNTLVLKHATNVSECSILLERIFLEAFEYPVFHSVFLDGKNVHSIIESSNIAAITFTGSTNVGRSIAKISGENLKKCVLELGGSDPYLILHDADIEKAAKLCATSRLLNAGQSCISAKRFLVDKKISLDFLDAFKVEFSKREIAPLAKEKLVKDANEQIQASLHLGAEIYYTSQQIKNNSYFFNPIILTNCSANMPVFQQETFSPVACVVTNLEEKEIIQLANQSAFGLGAAVFSKDLERAEQIARYELEAGTCFVNEFVKSDSAFPFGGIKHSGYGRELSTYTLSEFANLKTVRIFS
ncbi:MAG: aldehyde dehydrogenase family protein [Oligoflexia bacterium]|nr:aldehyde dehydrogenase family protein [Oligoflexia bacterium]